MIYALIGTDRDVRDKTYKEFAKLGMPSAHVYSEQIATLEPLTEATSLFGEKIVVNLLQTMEAAASRDEVLQLLPKMQASPNIFIIDEPFADGNRAKRLEKYAQKLYDARDLDKEKDLDVFTLCNLVARRDKKGAWIEWMRIRDAGTPEAIQGALWWKWTSVWGDAKAGRPGKYTLQECEDIGGRIFRSVIEAHRGEKDLKVELESILLSI